MQRFLLRLVLFAFLLPVPSAALEVYSLIHNGCEAQTGLIVHTDEHAVQMLNLDGKLAVLPRDEVELILVYNLHESPIHSFDLASGLKRSLREVRVDDKEQTHFIGWPIRFIEELIMFYDIHGKTHLVDLDRIDAFSDVDKADTSILMASKHENYFFSLGGNLPECRQTPEKDALNKRIEPTRMISDRIQVHKFLSVYQAGFTKLKRFQKKTAFYAKPFLYEKETRLGLVYTQPEYLQELNLAFPLFFQWSSGSPYGSQGQYVLGSQSVDLLPMVEPQFILRSDVKSHFFTGSFVGNALCISGGSDCIIQNRAAFVDFFNGIDQNAHMIYPQFNYMALTGAEYHEYSFSGGFYFPLYGIWGNGMFREVKSQQSTPVFRIQRTTRDLAMKLVVSQSSMSSDAPNGEGIELIRIDELLEYALITDESQQLIDDLDDYDLQTQFARFDLLYDLNDEVSLRLSEILFQGRYAEQYLGERYRLDFIHWITSVAVKQRFSDYTALKGEFNYFTRQNEYQKGGEEGAYQDDSFSFAVSIEFFL